MSLPHLAFSSASHGSTYDGGGEASTAVEPSKGGDVLPWDAQQGHSSNRSGA